MWTSAPALASATRACRCVQCLWPPELWLQSFPFVCCLELVCSGVAAAVLCGVSGGTWHGLQEC